jgi:hypothetical protein
MGISLPSRLKKAKVTSIRVDIENLGINVKARIDLTNYLKLEVKNG